MHLPTNRCRIYELEQNIKYMYMVDLFLRACRHMLSKFYLRGSALLASPISLGKFSGILQFYQ